MSPISPTSAPIEPIPNSDISTKKNLARSKWKVLASAIARKRNPSNRPDPESLLRFPSYRVIDARPVTSSSIDALLWFVVSLPQHLAIDLKICIVPPSQFTLHDLTGFNNTGNLCIWPAEECLTQFCFENIEMFDGKSVIELGGGMTSLAGLALAGSGHPRDVLLTDGNTISADNLERICRTNKSMTNLRSQMLRWDEVGTDLSAKFDVAISSDCLFFDEGRPQLLKCLKQVLVDGGLAFIVAPSRHETFQKFVDIVHVDGSFTVEQSDNYSEKISTLRQELSNDSRFDENLQYPKLLKLRKLPSRKE